MHKEGLQLTGSGCWDVPFLNASDITNWGIREYLCKYKEKFLLSLHKELNQAEENLQEIDKKIPYFLRCLLYTSPSPRDGLLSRMPSSA